MKIIHILLLMLIPVLNYPGLSWADIMAEKGDIVIFNMPLRTESIKVKLYVCKEQTANCKTWIPLTNDSPELISGNYYVFRLNSLKTNLEGTMIGAQVYSLIEKRWSDTLPLIQKYQQVEDPFYQFLCWARHEAPPHFFCISGAENKPDQME